MVVDVFCDPDQQKEVPETSIEGLIWCNSKIAGRGRRKCPENERPEEQISVKVFGLSVAVVSRSPAETPFPFHASAPPALRESRDLSRDFEKRCSRYDVRSTEYSRQF